MKWILKKGVRFPELKPAAFAIWALSWCSAGRTSYSLWVMAGTRRSWWCESLPERFPCCLRAVLLLYSSVNWKQQRYGRTVPSRQQFLWDVGISVGSGLQVLTFLHKVWQSHSPGAVSRHWWFSAEELQLKLPDCLGSSENRFFLMSSISQMIQASYWTTVLQQKRFWHFHILSCFEFISYSFSFMCRTST